MCEQAPPTPEETWKRGRKTVNTEYKIFLYYLSTITGCCVRSLVTFTEVGRIFIVLDPTIHPSFPQCLIRLEVWPTTEPPEHGSSMDGEPQQVHQFQKNNLLPCFEGSSLPSMVGLGSGRGLEW